MRWLQPRTRVGAVAIALALLCISAACAPAISTEQTAAVETSSTSPVGEHVEVVRGPALFCDFACAVWVTRPDTPVERANLAAWYFGHDLLDWLSRSAPDAPTLRSLRVCETGWVGGVFYPDGKADHYTGSYEGPYGMTHDTWRVHSYDLGGILGHGWPAGAHVARPWQVDMVARHLIARFGYEPWPVCGGRI